MRIALGRTSLRSALVLLRAAAYVVCGLGGVSSLALAQPALLPQPRQIEPAILLQRAELPQDLRPAADTNYPGRFTISAQQPDSNLKEVGPGGTMDLEAQLLLPLELQEQLLLQDFGPAHPQVRSVRARIEMVRDFIARQRAAQSIKPEPPPPALTGSPSAGGTTGASAGPGASVLVGIPLTFTAGTSADGGIRTVSHTDRSAVVPSAPAPFLLRLIPSVKDEKESQETREGGAAAADSSHSNEGGPAVRAASPSPATEEKTREGQAPVPTSGFIAGFSHLSGILLALLLFVAVHVLALFFFVRRYGARLSPLVRVEVVHTPTSAVASCSPDGGARSSAAQTLEPALPLSGAELQAAAAPDEPAADEGGQPFELGPTYEEEMRLKEEGARQQQEAVVRQIFEDNLRLMQQLGELQKPVARLVPGAFILSR